MLVPGFRAQDDALAPPQRAGALGSISADFCLQPHPPLAHRLPGRAQSSEFLQLPRCVCQDHRGWLSPWLTAAQATAVKIRNQEGEAGGGWGG